MTFRAVHWHEGMFLRPHHFQALQRHTQHLIHQNVRWDLHHCWGLRKLEFDPDALAAYRFVVRQLEARFRDGTVVALPGDGPEPAIDLKAAFQAGGRVDVFLAVPKFREGQSNAGESAQSRYRTDTLPLPDENTGVNAQPVPVRFLNARLLTGDQDRAGFEVVELARLKRADRPEATPELDESYIPPVLACDAWPVLQNDVLQNVHFRLRRKIEVLAAQVVSRGITFDSTSPGDARRMHQLMRMNEAYSLLGNLAFVPGVHPLPAYLELCRLVGQLAAFRRNDPRPPELPAYDHDDLGGCFWKVKQYIDDLLDGIEEPGYEERPFKGQGLRMQVSLESNWLAPGVPLFIGVRSTLSNEECVRLLTRPEKLGMKIGSSERVDTIFTRGQDGLRFTPTPRPPRDLPSDANLTYFEIDRSSSQAEWGFVQRSLSLAVRVKEGDIVGNIQDQHELTIRIGAQTTTLRFTLFVITQPTG